MRRRAAPTLPDPLALTVPVPAGAIALVLPLPPSVNHARTVQPVRDKRGNVRHIPVKTAATRDWTFLLGYHLRTCYPGVVCPPPPLALRVRLLVRSYQRIDADNVGKVIADGITRPLGVDDALVIDWHVTKHLLPARRGGPVRCEIILSSITPEEVNRV